MTQDEIIAMAKQALLPYYVDNGLPCNLMALERFALLVADHEREACAKLIESHGTWDNTETIAAAIRARGNND